MAESLEQRTLLSALTWSVGPSLPAPRGDAVSVSDGNATFVLGGSPASGGSSTAAQLPTGASNWTSAPPLDRARSAAGIAQTGPFGQVGNDSKYLTNIFMFGGAGPTTPTPSSTTIPPAIIPPAPRR